MVTGGGRNTAAGKGYFMHPTIFSDVKDSMKIAREEIFGPVVSAIRFSEIGEAVQRGNRTNYGLSAAVWTRDIKKAHTIARKLRAGVVWINTYNTFWPTTWRPRVCGLLWNNPAPPAGDSRLEDQT